MIMIYMNLAAGGRQSERDMERERESERERSLPGESLS